MPQHLSTDIKDRILKALEKDGTWLDRYNVTRDLYVPSGALKDHPNVYDGDNLDDILKVTDMVVEVCYRLDTPKYS